MSTNRYGSLAFNGTSSLIEVLDNEAIRFGTRDCTLEIAFKTSAVAAGVLFSKYDSGNSLGYSLQVLGDGTLRFTLNAISYTTTAVVNDGAWHWVMVTVDRTGSNVYVYVDGALDGVQSLAGLNDISNTENLFIGQSNAADTRFNGSITEVRFSNRKRETGSSYRVPQIQLADDVYTKLLFHFNEGAGTTCYDSSTARLHGTLTDGTWEEGPVITVPNTIVRDRIWLALDSYAPLTTFLDSLLPQQSSNTDRKFDGKYRYRAGDAVPIDWTPGNTPALIVVPLALPDMEPETVAHHKVMVPIGIEGKLHHKEVHLIETFWFLTLRAIWQMYQGTTTSGRLNWIGIQHMTPRGANFIVNEQADNTLFSTFEDSIAFEVRYDFLT